MRILVASSLLLLGLCLSMLLNGQEFTNGLLAILCSCLSASVALGTGKGRRSGGFVVAGLAVLTAIFLVAHLPAAYRSQIAFQRRVEQPRRAPKADPGSSPGPGAGASATIGPEDGGPPGGRGGR